MKKGDEVTVVDGPWKGARAMIVALLPNGIYRLKIDGVKGQHDAMSTGITPFPSKPENKP